MSYLNANTPAIECLVRGEFLRDMEDGHGTFYPCIIFGVASIRGQAPLFHCLMEDGGLFWRLPIHAFCWQECEALELGELVLWDSFSAYVTVTRFDLLVNKRMHYTARSQKQYGGVYLFTMDWSHEDANMPDCGFAEVPGQHKSGHVIALDTGHYAIQPNNRVRVFEPSFVTKPGETVIERRLHMHLWTAEQEATWRLSDDERYEYQIMPTPPAQTIVAGCDRAFSAIPGVWRQNDEWRIRTTTGVETLERGDVVCISPGNDVSVQKRSESPCP